MKKSSILSGSIALVIAVACNSPETKECHQKMAAAQNVVNAVESNSLDSVNRSIGAIEGAEVVCRRAGRSSELKELGQAKERLVGHRGLLEERADRRRSATLTPAQLEKLVRDGDPNCPKGQGYQNKASKKEIRCTGVQPVEMNWEQARKYLAGRNFRVVAGTEASVLTMESGAERFVFRYAERESRQPASCVIIQSRPGISWQEAVARNTGVPPEKLKNGGTISLAQGTLLLDVDEQNQIARIGNCPN